MSDLKKFNLNLYNAKLMGTGKPPVSWSEPIREVCPDCGLKVYQPHSCPVRRQEMSEDL